MSATQKHAFYFLGCYIAHYCVNVKLFRLCCAYYSGLQCLIVLLLSTETPAGQIPLLEHNGETIAQSMAIARYLAKEFNLAGKNNWEQAKADIMFLGLGNII